MTIRYQTERRSSLFEFLFGEMEIEKQSLLFCFCHVSFFFELNHSMNHVKQTHHFFS